jgi:hypothetical protein
MDGDTAKLSYDPLGLIVINEVICHVEHGFIESEISMEAGMLG